MGSGRGVALVMMCAGMFFVLLDVTTVNVALPSIGAGVGTRHLADLQWVVDGHQVALAGLLPAGLALGDRYGHRRVVVIGFAVFALASAACALAPGIGALVAARVAQGAGAALLLSTTPALIGALHPGRAVGAWAAVGSLALPAGPVLGGALVRYLGWPWVFWLNVPVIALVILVVLRTVPEHDPEGETEPRPLDVLGVVLGTATLTLAVFIVIEAGRLGTYARPVWLAAAVAVACGVAFTQVEGRKEDPALPMALLRRPSIALGTVAAATMNFGVHGVMLLLTFYLQAVRHLTPLAAGVSLLTLFVPLVVLPALGGRLAGRHGPRPVMLAGLVLLVAGFLLLLRLTPESAYVPLFPAMAVIGAGAGLLTSSVVALTRSAAPPGGEGPAGLLDNTARQAGGAMGVAVLGALAGDPATPDTFVTGLRHAALVAAAAFLAVAVLTVVTRADV
ncbi:MFS transporter [Nonomuraea sp. NN258]|uniref:MFS transporter n=1 Tax=Nonomuraea antri TaxID=2730852 RepID=UPI00156959BA|nr:MFS transporter [Nonomuraea antri]NRQ39621.1 MFS transporter [Nonomuraea antri]